MGQFISKSRDQFRDHSFKKIYTLKQEFQLEEVCLSFSRNPVDKICYVIKLTLHSFCNAPFRHRISVFYQRKSYYIIEQLS